MSKSNIKTMLIVFFDVKRIVMAEYVPPGQTMNKNTVLSFCQNCKKEFREREGLWENVSLLHQDSCSIQHAISLAVSSQKQVSVLDGSPYSPDLAPCNFFLN
jgi:hypothetical protein